MIIGFGGIGWVVIAALVIAFGGWFFLSKGLNWLQKNKKA